MVPGAHLLVLHAQALQPVDAELFPVSKPLQIRSRRAEELQLHLLELPGAERKVARRDLISKGLADLPDAEGDLLPGSPLDILKVDKNALSRLRS